MGIVDKHPQWGMHTRLTETAANTFSQVSANTPVVHSLQNGRALVMEILRLSCTAATTTIGGDADEVNGSISERSRATVGQDSDSDTLAHFSSGIHRFTTSGATKSLRALQSNSKDHTDGAGNGSLFAEREMFFQSLGVSQAAATVLDFKILYRLVEVSAVELLGITAN